MTKTIIAASPERIQAVEALVTQAMRVRPEAVSALLSFEGREDYLGFVAAWKAVYATAAETVRGHRRVMRDPGVSIDARATAQSNREVARGRARAALVLRAAGKDIARAARRPLRAEAA